MIEFISNRAISSVNFLAGMALLLMLYPVGGKLPEKPAGVRTAIELVGKKHASETMQRSVFVA